jgi:V/A-type H+/Na+-transporting ATPase subunit D
MAENEAPSKTVLLERREERALVGEGKSVLEERRDILAQAMMVELRGATQSFETMTAKLAEALKVLRLAAMRHGPGGLSRLAASPATRQSPGWRVVNHFGTRLLEISRVDGDMPVESRWDSSEDVALARRHFHDLMPGILETAARTNNLMRLTREFRRTQRKVNALEYVVIPELEQSIRSIEFSLEETERENMVRALGVKRKLDHGASGRSAPE